MSVVDRDNIPMGPDPTRMIGVMAVGVRARVRPQQREVGAGHKSSMVYRFGQVMVGNLRQGHVSCVADLQPLVHGETYIAVPLARSSPPPRSSAHPPTPLCTPRRDPGSSHIVAEGGYRQG